MGPKYVQINTGIQFSGDSQVAHVPSFTCVHTIACRRNFLAKERTFNSTQAFWWQSECKQLPWEQPTKSLVGNNKEYACVHCHFKTARSTAIFNVSFIRCCVHIHPVRNGGLTSSKRNNSRFHKSGQRVSSILAKKKSAINCFSTRSCIYPQIYFIKCASFGIFISQPDAT